MVTWQAYPADLGTLLGSTAFAFVDVEFTTLDERYRRPWEIAVIHYSDGQREEHRWLIADVDLAGADEEALAVGGFHERHPRATARASTDDARVQTEAETAAELVGLLKDVQWVGVVPDSDASTITAMLRRHGLEPSWHYQLVDAAVYAAGVMRTLPPRISWAVSESMGVLAHGRRLHHALEDARWAHDLFIAALAYR